MRGARKEKAVMANRAEGCYGNWKWAGAAVAYLAELLGAQVLLPACPRSALASQRRVEYGCDSRALLTSSGLVSR